MPEETTPTAAAESSSPLADALIDFNALGSPPPEVKAEAEDDGSSFLEEFNRETPAPEEKPVETPPTETPAEETEKDEIDEIKAPAGASEKTVKGMADLKKMAKDFKQKAEAAEKLRTQELADRDKRIAELEEKMAALPELSEKAKFAEEAERELAISRVEATREYKATIDAPLVAIEKAALAIATANDIPADTILDAITEPDGAKRRELMKGVIANLDDLDKQEVLRMAGDTQELLRKRDEIRNRATDALKEQEERQKATETLTKKQAREAFEREAENTVAELRKRLPFIPIADGETADNVFTALLTKAKATDLDSASVTNKAFAAASAIFLPRMAKQLAKVQEENKTLLARIAEGNKGRATVTDKAEAPITEGGDFFGNLGIADPGAKIKQLQ